MFSARSVLPPAALVFLVACAAVKESPLAPYLKDRQAAAFVFLAPDCPLSQNSSPTLNELQRDFQTKGIELYGVFPGQAGAEGAEDFVRTYKIQFPILKDPDLRIADFLEATTTPEAFIVDHTGRKLYSGAIDNRAPELGQLRTVITEHYLKDALESIVEGQAVKVQGTRPIGCFIERAKSAHLLPDRERI